jgi:hypothetical protein
MACPAGYVCAGGVHTPCPAGTFSSGAAASALELAAQAVITGAGDPHAHKPVPPLRPGARAT